MRPEQIYKRSPQIKHAASLQTLFPPVLFGRKKVYDMMHSTLEIYARRKFHRCVDTAKGVAPRGNAWGDLCILWGGPKDVPRGMSAYAVSYFCEDERIKCI